MFILDVCCTWLLQEIKTIPRNKVPEAITRGKDYLRSFLQNIRAIMAKIKLPKSSQADPARVN